MQDTVSLFTVSLFVCTWSEGPRKHASGPQAFQKLPAGGQQMLPRVEEYWLGHLQPWALQGPRMRPPGSPCQIRALRDLQQSHPPTTIHPHYHPFTPKRLPHLFSKEISGVPAPVKDPSDCSQSLRQHTWTHSTSTIILFYDSTLCSCTLRVRRRSTLALWPLGLPTAPEQSH